MWNLVWNPVRFFEARRHRHADWLTALAAPALCAGLQAVSVSIFSGKTRPTLDTVLARLDLPLTGLPSGHLVVAMSALTYPMYFGLLTLAVLALDVLANDSGQPARLTELTALSFYTQVPYCLVMILIAWVWVPEPMWLTSKETVTSSQLSRNSSASPTFTVNSALPASTDRFAPSAGVVETQLLAGL